MDDVKSETSCSVNKTDFKTFNVFMLFAKWYCKSSIPLPKYYYLQFPQISLFTNGAYHI